jgi:hypothetical protein
VVEVWDDQGNVDVHRVRPADQQGALDRDHVRVTRRATRLTRRTAPGQCVDVDPEDPREVAEDGVAVDRPEAAFDLRQPGLRSADQTGYGSLA